MDELYTVGQAAKKLNMSPEYVRRLCDTGKITVKKTAGGHRRIPHCEVGRLMAAMIPATEEAQKYREIAVKYLPDLHYALSEEQLFDIGRRLYDAAIKGI